MCVCVCAFVCVCVICIHTRLCEIIYQYKLVYKNFQIQIFRGYQV